MVFTKIISGGRRCFLVWVGWCGRREYPEFASMCGDYYSIGYSMACVPQVGGCMRVLIGVHVFIV